MSIPIEARDPDPMRAVTDVATDQGSRPWASLASTAAPSWTWWLARLLVTAEAFDAFLQAVFEGRFLSGDFAMLSIHRTNATYVGVLSVSLAAVAILAWRISRIPGRIVLGLVVLGPMAGLQIFLGFTRILGIHVPLGVAMIAQSSWLTVWMWTHHPARWRADRRTGGRRETS